MPQSYLGATQLTVGNGRRVFNAEALSQQSPTRTSLLTPFFLKYAPALALPPTCAAQKHVAGIQEGV